jgi:hypothetical protein
MRDSVVTGGCTVVMVRVDSQAKRRDRLVTVLKKARLIEGLVNLSLNSVLERIFSIGTSRDVLEACPKLKYWSINFCPIKCHVW